MLPAAEVGVVRADTFCDGAPNRSQAEPRQRRDLVMQLQRSRAAADDVALFRLFLKSTLDLSPLFAGSEVKKRGKAETGKRKQINGAGLSANCPNFTKGKACSGCTEANGNEGGKHRTLNLEP